MTHQSSNGYTIPDTTEPPLVPRDLQRIAEEIPLGANDQVGTFARDFLQSQTSKQARSKVGVFGEVIISIPTQTFADNSVRKQIILGEVMFDSIGITKTGNTLSLPQGRYRVNFNFDYITGDNQGDYEVDIFVSTQTAQMFRKRDTRPTTGIGIEESLFVQQIINVGADTVSFNLMQNQLSMTNSLAFRYGCYLTIEQL